MAYDTIQQRIPLTLAGNPTFKYNNGLAKPIQPNNFLAPMKTNPQNLTLAGGSPDYNFGSTDALKLNDTQIPGNGFSFTDAINNFSLGAQGVAGLAGAYNAWQQTGLMKDQLNLQKNMVNRNIGNQATLTNKALEDRASLTAQLNGNSYGTPEYLAAKEKLKVTVDGSPIG